MMRGPTKSNSTATLFPDTTLVRSQVPHHDGGGRLHRGRRRTGAAGEHAAGSRSSARGRGRGQGGELPAPRHREPLVRAPLPARRSHSGERCESGARRSEEHTSELPSLMRIYYAILFLKKQKP